MSSLIISLPYLFHEHLFSLHLHYNSKHSNSERKKKRKRRSNFWSAASIVLVSPISQQDQFNFNPIMLMVLGTQLFKERVMMKTMVMLIVMTNVILMMWGMIIILRVMLMILKKFMKSWRHLEETGGRRIRFAHPKKIKNLREIL